MSNDHMEAALKAVENLAPQDNEVTDAKLLECPLCTGPAILAHTNPSVVCVVCGCEAWGDNIDEAVRRWNGRPAPDGLAAAEYALPHLRVYAETLAGTGEDIQECCVLNAISKLERFIAKARGQGAD